MQGWLKLHRKLLESNMYHSLNAKQRDVMFVCLMLANHADNEWEFNGDIYKCKSGQFVSSLDHICRNCAKETKVQSVRTALLKLEKWQFLTNESTKTGRLITICKWGAYQDFENQTNNDANKDLTKTQQRPNKELTTNNNVKNNKNDKNKDIESVWKEFPHKTEFVSCLKLFDKKQRPKTDSQKINWINTFRILVEKDEYKPSEIVELVTWARNDEFWKKNILSFASIRNKKNDVSKIDQIKAHKPSNKTKNEGDKFIW